MISIEVVRAPGDRQAPDIVDPLINSAEVALARGRAEIDGQYSNRILLSGTGPYTGWRAPGRLAELHDADLGVVRGLLRDVSINIVRTENSFQADLGLLLEHLDEE